MVAVPLPLWKLSALRKLPSLSFTGAACDRGVAGSCVVDAIALSKDEYPSRFRRLFFVFGSYSLNYRYVASEKAFSAASGNLIGTK